MSSRMSATVDLRETAREVDAAVRAPPTPVPHLLARDGRDAPNAAQQAMSVLRMPPSVYARSQFSRIGVAESIDPGSSKHELSEAVMEKRQRSGVSCRNK